MNPTNNQISESKLVSFAIGQQKKSRFQKAREDKELKQKLDDEATAKVYDSFVSSFTEEEDGKTFVRGGLSRGHVDSTYGGNRGDVYKMDRNQATGGSEMDKIAQEMKDREAERSARQVVNSSAPAKGKRQIDDFLSEIMNRQESQTQQNSSSSSDSGRYDRGDRDHRDRGNGESASNVMSTSLSGGFIEKGSYDNGDPTTTNLYLGNLAPITTEEHLLEVFGRYGDINSVKIMWPRTEEEKARKRNCGFVSFKLRADAEDALIELQDTDLEGYKMILGWGKAVKISAAPFTLPPSMRSAVPALPAPQPFTEINHMGVGAFPPGAPVPPPFAHHPPFPSAPFAGAAPPGYGPPQPPFAPPSVPGVAFRAPGVPLPPGFPAPPPSQPHQQQGGGTTQAAGAPTAYAPPSQASPPPVPTVTSPADLSTMSVDNFLDSIIASVKPAVPAAPVPASQAVQIPSVSVPDSVPEPPVQSVRSRWGSTTSQFSENVELPSPDVQLPFVPQPPQLPAFRPPPPTSAMPTVFADLQALTPFEHIVPHVPQPPLSPPPTTPLVVNITVTLPEDPERQALIDLVAKFTAADGDAFEKNIKVREEGNPIYAFLFDLECQEGQYYRWRTFAYAWGDSALRWHDQPLQWSTEGLVIAPPTCTAAPEEAVVVDKTEGTKHSHKESRENRRKRSRSPSHDRSRHSRRSRSRSTSHDRHGGNRRRAGESRRSRSHSRDRDREHSHRASDRGERGRDHRDHRDNKHRRDTNRNEDSAADRSRYATMTGAQIERERTKKRLLELARLGKEDYEEWKRKLQALDLSRESIKQAMGFAFDKVESADEIVTMIKDKLILPSSYGAVKIAGLYLLSDLLHNSGAPVKHATAYRSLVQGVLPEVFENVSVLFHSTSGRMSSFNIEDRVKKLFSIWAEWSVFPTMYLIGLQAAFYFTESDRTALHSFVAEREEEDALDGISLVPDLSSAENEALEALRKRARAQGVHYTDSTGKYELQFKIEHGEKFSQLRYGQSNVSSISTLLTPYESLADVSQSSSNLNPYSTGDVTHIGERPSSHTGLTPLEQILQEEGAEYDDDIDGVPMEIGEYVIPVSSAPPPNVTQ